jgi:hypothetical protein
MLKRFWAVWHWCEPVGIHEGAWVCSGKMLSKIEVRACIEQNIKYGFDRSRIVEFTENEIKLEDL